MTDVADVSTHFRIPILSGQSTFTVRVPRHHLENNRKFFFSQLNLVPDYFSQDAEMQNIDADPDLEKMINKEVYIKVKYEDYKKVYTKTGYNNTTTTPKLKDAIAAINAHYESNKPDFAITTPLFIDWVDIKEEPTQDSIDYVPKLCLVYYGQERSSDFIDFLPPSARVIDGANNFMPPLGTMESKTQFAERIRLRLWLAPYTKAIFSSKDPFSADFGFLDTDMGTYYPQYKQYHLPNDSPNWRAVLIGKLAPNVDLLRKEFRLAVIPSRSTNEGFIRNIQMKKRDWYDNAKVTELLADRFKQTLRLSNTHFSFGFNTDEKRFFFSYPQSDNISIIIQCEPDFAHRLGFGNVTTITKEMKAAIQEEKSSIVDAKKKALTVVYDTGPILCTLDQMSSNTTSGALDHHMASLNPHESGILAMPPPSPCSCTANLTTIHPLTQTLAAYIPITFRLLRIYEDQSISDFAWKCKAYVYGVLQGTCRKV